LPRVGVSLGADWEVFGIGADLFILESSSSVVNIGDNAKLWAKPWKFLKITVGKFKDDTLRGKIGDTDFYDYTYAAGAEDDIFTRFSGNGQGALIGLTPIDGLFLGVLVNADGGFFTGAPSAENVWKKAQFGVGYALTDIAHVRVGFVGGLGAKVASDYKDDIGNYTWKNGAYVLDPDKEKAALKALTTGSPHDPSVIEAAFQLTAVEALNLDLGFKIPLAVTDTTLLGKDGKYQKAISVALAANFAAGDLGIWGRVDTSFAGKTTTDSRNSVNDPFALKVHVTPSYNLGFAKLGVDVGLGFTGNTTSKVAGKDVEAKDSGFGFGIGPWIQKGLGNGTIKAGLGFTSPTFVDGNSTGSLVLSIPIILEYGF
jgi:hypothetical protein